MIKKITSLDGLSRAPESKNAGQTHYRVPEFDLPAPSYAGRLIQNADELETLVAPWNRLIETAVRPNPFFDPDFLIPAIRHLGDSRISVLVVDAPLRANPKGPRVICGIFPLVRKRFYGLPISCLEIWKHDQCFDCTPLIRHDCAAEVIEYIFAFLGEQRNVNLISMNTVAGEGAFANLLSDNFYRQSRTVFHRDEFTRACFRPMEDADEFINSKVSKSTRKGTLRLSRKLATQGNLVTADSAANHQPWIEEFLELESAGWKGQSGTALASNPSTNRFFREMAARMLSHGKLIISRTSLDDRPISMFCDLLQRGQGAHFKTTFDESLSEYSPGLIAEFANLHRMHQAGIEFVDSGADPDHSMINRVWPDRVRYQSLVIAVRGPVSRFATSMFPLMQLASSLFKKRR